MGMLIYVCGAVPRQGLAENVNQLLNSIYSDLQHIATERGHQISLPYPEAELDSMSAEAFSTAIEERISQADAVLTVLVVERASVGFEGKRASELGKKQALIAPDDGNVSRLLLALPNITGVFQHDAYGLKEAVLSITTEGDLVTVQEPLVQW